MNTISGRVSITKILIRGLSSDRTSNSQNKLYKECMTDCKENFHFRNWL